MGSPRGGRAEARVDDGLPEVHGPLAALGRSVRGSVDVLAEEPFDAALDLRARCVVLAVRRVRRPARWFASIGHRSPSPRATMPRRISRVPPRSENEGAARVT